MASDSETEKNPEDLMEDLKEILVELTGDLKKLGYDHTRLIDPLLVDTGPPVDYGEIFPLKTKLILRLMTLVIISHRNQTR
jgi:hypothetical protein